MRLELDERFWNQVDKESSATGCWLWQGYIQPKGRKGHGGGYGTCRWNGRMWLAHRLAYTKLVGPIPDDLQLDHLCNTPACVRPEHLQPVTGDENMRRRNQKRTFDDIEKHAQEQEAARRRINEEKSKAAMKAAPNRIEVTDVADRELQERMTHAAELLTDNIPFSAQKPTPRQRAFLLDFGREAFYGGAAAGGKSSALLMSALQFIEVPRYAALIIRRTYADLAKPGALMDRAFEWFKPTAAKWNQEKKQWKFPSGATINFGYIEAPNDRLKFQSAEYQFVGFDEVTQFPIERDYTYLFSRCRRPDGETGELGKVPLRMRSAGNPGGPGHEWVRRRFIVEGALHGRSYYAASLEDNPHIDQAEYELALEQLDYYERLQLRYGDWFAAPPGSMFRREWFQLVEHEGAHRDVIRYWKRPPTPKDSDTEPDYLVGMKVAMCNDGTFEVLGVARLRDTPGEGEKLMKAIAVADGRKVRVYVEEEVGEVGKALQRHLRREVFPPNWPVRPAKRSGDPVMRAGLPSSLAQEGRVKLLRKSWNEDFITEAEQYPNGPTGSQVNALSGAFVVLEKRARTNLSSLGVQSSEQANVWSKPMVLG